MESLDLKLQKILFENLDSGYHYSGYHCTNKDAAASILKDGFKSVPDFEDFLNHDDELMISILAMLSDEDYRKYMKIWNSDSLKSYLPGILQKWNKKYNIGTLIWLTEEPDTTYGEICLTVRLPIDSELIYNSDYGSLYYVPYRIPPRCFSVNEKSSG
jgi:hypothetical protein